MGIRNIGSDKMRLWSSAIFFPLYFIALLLPFKSQSTIIANADEAVIGCFLLLLPAAIVTKGKDIFIKYSLFILTILLIALIVLSGCANGTHFLWAVLGLLNFLFPLLLFLELNVFCTQHAIRQFILFAKIVIILNFLLVILQYSTAYVIKNVPDFEDVGCGLFTGQANMLSYYALYTIVFWNFISKNTPIPNAGKFNFLLHILLIAGNGRGAWLLYILYSFFNIIRGRTGKDLFKLTGFIGGVFILLAVVSIPTGHNVWYFATEKLFKQDLVGLYLHTEFGRGAYYWEAINLAAKYPIGIGPAEFGDRIAKINSDAHLYTWLKSKAFKTIWGQELPMDTVANANIAVFLAQYGWGFIVLLLCSLVIICIKLFFKISSESNFIIFTFTLFIFIDMFVMNVAESFDIFYLTILIFLTYQLNAIADKLKHEPDGEQHPLINLRMSA
jgi:hypothetical protein